MGLEKLKTGFISEIVVTSFVALITFFVSHFFQAQFILCIIHTIRALFSQQCQFSKFISSLLLLNSSIFFCLFMNFYIQAYKKGKNTTALAAANQAATCASESLQKPKSLEVNNNHNSQDILPSLSQKKVN